MKNIFIVGASGLVGSNCQKYFMQHGHTVLGSHFSFPTANTVFFDTLNLDNPDNTNLDIFQPDIIVHCGALTHVDYCEDHVDESYEKTVLSTIHCIALAKNMEPNWFISPQIMYLMGNTDLIKKQMLCDR